MKTKEVLEARWKVLIFAFLALLASGGNVVSYPLLQPAGNGGIPHPSSVWCKRMLPVPSMHLSGRTGSQRMDQPFWRSLRRSWEVG